MVARLLPTLAFSFSFVALLAAFSSVGSAEQPDPNLDSGGCVALSEGFLNGRLAYWQPRLELQGWKVSVAMAHAADLKPKTLGNIHWDMEKKTAVIHVLDASEYQLPCLGMLEDMEFTVVHELVHLELSSLPRSQASRGDEEHAVNRLTDALLALQRQKPGGDAARELTSKPGGLRSRADAPAPTW
jgi:hypothetical protein